MLVISTEHGLLPPMACQSAQSRHPMRAHRSENPSISLLSAFPTFAPNLEREREREREKKGGIVGVILHV